MIKMAQGNRNQMESETERTVSRLNPYSLPYEACPDISRQQPRNMSGIGYADSLHALFYICRAEPKKINIPNKLRISIIMAFSVILILFWLWLNSIHWQWYYGSGVFN
jgi:hypothetical protein